ncbi:hypothetical protein [Bacteroides neonati]|uniref:hypothetical protein n=1 Tax=Bacteroides neonati TaxID=1347393 RepID=UPI0011DCBCBE|nr:hypothetical protein [Bacteroides neonati]
MRKYNALMSFYFHIPFPEQLPDEVWAEKMRQIEWLSTKGMLGVKVEKQAIQTTRVAQATQGGNK